MLGSDLVSKIFSLLGRGLKSSGTVRINFDEDDVEGLDRDSLQVYFYNTSVSEWEALDSTVGEDFVEADVDHFSVYSVFGQEESDSSSTVSVGSGSSGGAAPVDQPEETGEESGEEESGTDGETGQDPEDQGTEEPGDSTSQEEPGQEPETGETSVQGLTGQFTEAVSNPLSGLVVLLLAAAGYLAYSGRYRDVRDFFEGLIERFRS